MPEVTIESRRNTLQLLVHGATYNRNYWSGNGTPGQGWQGDPYSWVNYASMQGYPTLAIDHLGNGLSDHPDPILIAQYPAQVETTHEVIVKIRDGTAGLSRAFDNIIFAGHSYGSIVGNDLVSKYPTDVDAVIVAGYSSSFLLSLGSVFANALPLPATIVAPPKFGTLHIGYLMATSQTGIQNVSWNPGNTGYDPAFPPYHWSLRGTISAGEAATVPFAFHAAEGFTGSAMIVTGNNDQIFCSPVENPLSLNPGGLLGALLGTAPSGCGSDTTGYLAQSKVISPNAKNYEWYAVPTAGYCWQLHYSAQDGFGQVHDWMERQGF